jgi:putative Holliday junction resolvase
MIKIEDFKKINSKKTRLIVSILDQKDRCINCDEKRMIATPFKTIHKTTGKNFIEQIKEIVDENEIGGIIVGNPLNMDGSLGRSAQSVNDVIRNVKNVIDIPIILWDERLSTVGAFNLSSQIGINVSKREKKIDENAAAFILQGAIDFLNN